MCFFAPHLFLYTLHLFSLSFLSDGRLRHAGVFSLHICFFTLYIFSLFMDVGPAAEICFFDDVMEVWHVWDWEGAGFLS